MNNINRDRFGEDITDGHNYDKTSYIYFYKF